MKKLLTTSEWEIMRVIWTLGEATTNQIIHIMHNQKDWQPSTVKTLINRILKKDLLRTDGATRNRLYIPTVGEHEMMTQSLRATIDDMCAMCIGNTLVNVLADIALSQSDIVKLQSLLEQKMKSAPESIACNCLPENCEECQ
ncbi:CopY/TcrY family copper transport repressor [Leuconostoc mesenteroides]